MSTLLAELCEPIAVDLRRVEEIFQDALDSELPPVQALCRHVRRLRGKMLRPALLLLAGQACGNLRDEHHKLAAVIEMVHMASLVHDNVLDEADIRRKAVTVNRLTSNETAVMLGDFLISRSLRLCCGLSSQLASQVVAAAAATVFEGELLQLSNRGNFQLSEQTYFAIIERKTAALTAAATELGALYADAPAHAVRGLRDFGRGVGIAFQIVDDVLDITGREEQAGKTLGTDARQGKLTLPMIHHLRTRPDGHADRLLACLQAPQTLDRARVQDLLTETGSLDHARRVAGDYVTRAIASLDCLPPSPARTQLQTMTEFIVARQF